LLLLALLLAPVMASAQTIDAEANKEYELHVLLRCGTHPWLGSAFRAELREELTGMLADVLGPMARIGVIDVEAMPWAKVWDGIVALGFPSLESPRVMAPAKTQLVRIDFVDGQYQVQARQLDGQTNLASPWRHERTPDRVLVARLVGKLIAQDFGIIGTIA